MRMTNKLKIIIVCLLTYISIILTSIAAHGQGGPPYGPGGPSGPPPSYCDQFPNDPACTNVAVPIGDWKWQLGLVLCGMGFAIYTMRKKDLSTQNNES